MPEYIQKSLPGIPGQQKAIRVLTETECQILLATSRQGYFRDYVMFQMALLTGLRNSELLGLRIEHIAPYGVITTQLELTADIAKGGRARTIPLHTSLREDLQAFLGWKEQRGQTLALSAPLFVTANTGRKLQPRDFQRITKMYAKHVIGRKITPHMFRHTFATMVLRRANIRVVQELLGHANIQTTQIYTHPTTSEMSDAVDALAPPTPPTGLERKETL